jgi:8-hydroxy-5-deazaflavin:NADPH oxidoreductase
MSTISIIGTGSMASALAGGALAGGNEVEIIGRNATKAKELAARGDRHPRRAVRQRGGSD